VLPLVTLPPAPLPPRTRRRPFALVAVLLLALPLLTGCLRAQLTMGVSSSDQVTGQLVVAVPRGGTPPTLTVPAGLGSAVTVDPYSQDGYTGSVVRFTALSFAQLQLLSGLSADAAGAFSLNLRRSGDIVTLDGTVDLTKVTADGADVTIKISFPSPVTTTNGTPDGTSGITWTTAKDGTLKVGQSNQLQASVRYDDPTTRSFTQWALILGGIVLGVALLVAVIAVLARDRSPRPGRVHR
jgi:hypothetical protein